MGQEWGELSRGGHTDTKVSVGESRVRICEQLAHTEHRDTGWKMGQSPRSLGLVDQVKDMDHHQWVATERSEAKERSSCWPLEMRTLARG